jgi:formiminoglutamase
MPLQPTTESLYFSKKDANDPRLGESAHGVKAPALSKNLSGWSVLGYADDEGIAMNGGRVGARLAPDLIRKYFYKMTPPHLSCPAFHDFGNLQSEGSLPERHQQAKTLVQDILSTSSQIFTLGGGHDYGYSDAAGFIESLPKSSVKPLILNFDAHLDVRPTEKGFHSGTPFYRLLQEYGSAIDFVEVGIQPQCNSPHHRKWAEERGATILSQQSLERVGMVQALQETVGTNPARPLWISLDMDAFCSKEAPGCSQSFATGLEINPFLAALKYLQSNFSLRGMGIYEVSPPLDQDDRTSKLAALIMYHAVFSQWENES